MPKGPTLVALQALLPGLGAASRVLLMWLHQREPSHRCDTHTPGSTAATGPSRAPQFAATAEACGEKGSTSCPGTGQCFMWSSPAFGRALAASGDIKAGTRCGLVLYTAITAQLGLECDGASMGTQQRSAVFCCSAAVPTAISSPCVLFFSRLPSPLCTPEIKTGIRQIRVKAGLLQTQKHDTSH